MRIAKKHDCSVERFVNALHNLPGFRTFKNWTQEECAKVEAFENYTDKYYAHPACVYGIIEKEGIKRMLYAFDIKDSDAYLLNVLWRQDKSVLTFTWHAAEEHRRHWIDMNKFMPETNYAIYWRPETNEEIKETKKCISLNFAHR